MRAGAGVSGAAHLALIVLVIFSGKLFTRGEARPVTFAEVTMMTGAEFEAARSAAPSYDPDLPAAPASPKPGKERADVALADRDLAPTPAVKPETPAEPERGESVVAPEPPRREIAVGKVGEKPAAPLAPEDDAIAAAEVPTERAPVSETVVAPTPAARPAAPKVETSTPTPPASEPKPAEVAATPPPEPEAQPKPEPEPKIAPELETAEAKETLNDPDTPAPKLAPPPPTKPRDVPEAKEAERPAKKETPPAETGATKTAEAPSGGGSSKTVGKLSFRDVNNLKTGIGSNFAWSGGGDENLFVTIRVEVGLDGKIIGQPTVTAPATLTAQHRALANAGMRALGKSSAKGVFNALPKDKHERWRVMNVTFTPREVRFL